MTISRRLAFGAAALPLAIAASRRGSPRPINAPGDTLDTIIKRGTLIVGTSLGTPPYGLTNADMEPDGYDVGMAKLIARELGA